MNDQAAIPDNSPPCPWPLLGILALGSVAGAACGGYAVSPGSPMRGLVRYANRIGNDLAATGRGGRCEPPQIGDQGMLANERPLSLKMLHSATQRSVIATPGRSPIRKELASLPSLSLESRLALWHRRRRLASLKRLLVSFVLVGISLLVLVAAFGAVAGSR
jgi:hypothetical protein